MALTTKKKRATEQATQQQTEEQEVAALLSAFESTRPVEMHSFEVPPSSRTSYGKPTRSTRRSWATTHRGLPRSREKKTS